MGKYVYFKKAVSKTKTDVCSCHSTSDNKVLGIISWCVPCNQYSFFSNGGVPLSKDRLREIADFLDSVMKE